VYRDSNMGARFVQITPWRVAYLPSATVSEAVCDMALLGNTRRATALSFVAVHGVVNATQRLPSSVYVTVYPHVLPDNSPGTSVVCHPAIIAHLVLVRTGSAAN